MQLLSQERVHTVLVNKLWLEKNALLEWCVRSRSDSALKEEAHYYYLEAFSIRLHDVIFRC